MTEAQWLVCTNPLWMLHSVSDRTSDRKLRLFACACARTVWHHLNEPQRRAVEVAEQVADALATAAELGPHRCQGMGVAAGTGRTAAESAIHRVIEIFNERKFRDYHPDRDAPRGQLESKEPDVRLAACAVARCVLFPFSSRPRGPDWRSADVVAIARGANAERPLADGALVPVRLSILADALEDAGCGDSDLLGHLRSPGPHVRGCWALDLVLGKE